MVIAYGLDLQEIVERSDSPQLRVGLAAHNGVEKFARFAGGTDDYALAVLQNNALGDYGIAVEVFQIALGNHLVEVFEAHLVFHKEDDMSRPLMLHAHLFQLAHDVLDVADPQPVAKGCIITRPFDLGMPDVLKSIKDIRIRGQYAKGAVQFMLFASMDGIHFHYLNSLRGKSWKLFRIIILTDLSPTERVSWIDVDFEPRFQNRLR